MKIKEIKIVNQDESTEIADIGADAINVDYNNTTVKNELDKLNTVDNSLMNIQTNQGNTLTNLQSQISSLASGSPLVASSVSGMTDTSRVYVNTSDGKWYYYNGSSWVSGGIYQSAGIDSKEIKLNNFDDKLKTDLYDVVTANDVVWSKTSLYQGNENWDAKVITSPFIYMPKGSIITFNSEKYKTRITLYDDNKNYISNTGTYSVKENYTVSDNYYVRIGIVKIDETASVISEGVSENVSFVGYVKKENHYNYNDKLNYTINTIDDSGNPSWSNNRILSELFNVGKGTIIKLKDYYTNYRFCVDIYNNEGVYQISRQWGTDDYIVNADSKIRIRIAHNNNAVITSTEINLYKKVIDIFHIENYTLIDNSINLGNEVVPLMNKSINIYECASHRGYFTYGTIEIPENTIEAYKYSVNKGFDMIETDVRFTSDNIPIICHDETINRTARNSDGTELSSNVNVGLSTFDELNQYDYGIYVSSKYANTKLLTFDEVCRFAKYNNIKINIDSKTYQENQLSILYNIIKKYGLQHLVRITVPSKNLANYLLTLNPKLYIAVGAWEPTTQVIDDIVDLKNTYPNARIIADFYAGLTTDDIHEYLIEKDVEVNYYVESNSQIIKAVDYGAIGFTVNLDPPYDYLKSVYDN